MRFLEERPASKARWVIRGAALGSSLGFAGTTLVWILGLMPTSFALLLSFSGFSAGLIGGCIVGLYCRHVAELERGNKQPGEVVHRN